MTLTVKDLEKLQTEHPDYGMELIHGEIIVMSPSGYESEEIASEFSRQLGNWTKPRQLGRVTGSNTDFVLPNSDTRAPDVSFVAAERLRIAPRSFAELAPDLMVEVKSPTDSIKKSRGKNCGVFERRDSDWNSDQSREPHAQGLSIESRARTLSRWGHTHTA